MPISTPGQRFAKRQLNQEFYFLNSDYLSPISLATAFFVEGNASQSGISFVFERCYRQSQVSQIATLAIRDRILQNAPRSAHSLQVALNAMPVGVAWANLSDLRITFMNRKFTETFGYTADEFVDLRQWIATAYPFAEDRALARQTWQAYFVAPDGNEVDVEPIELRVLCKDGSLKTIIQSGVILPANNWALSTFVDITERKQYELMLQAAERAAHESETIYQLLLQHSSEMIVLSPFDQSRRFVSPAVGRLSGFTAEEYLSMKGLETVNPLDHESVTRAIEAIKRGQLLQVVEYRILQKDGGYRWVEATISGYVDPFSQTTAGYVATVRDISEQKKREAQLASVYLELSEAASMDELTGIANRRTFNQTLERESLLQTRATGDLSLLLLDIDYFKQYNDLYGHLAGDACLKRVAEALKAVLHRECDLVARFGGEEFVVLLPATESLGAESIARDLLEAISSLAIPHGGSSYGILTISIGVSSSRAGLPLDRSLLLDQADRSLYRAKRGGRNMIDVNDEQESTVNKW